MKKDSALFFLKIEHHMNNTHFFYQTGFSITMILKLILWKLIMKHILLKLGSKLFIQTTTKFTFLIFLVNEML